MQNINIKDNCFYAEPVLDKGFIRVIDKMGNDAAIVQAARVSYGKGTKVLRDDEGLIRYLLRHRHTTPFEMCEIKLHIKAPLFIARQWIRHRTANVNEISGRYSELSNDMYEPELYRMMQQSESNKQGSGEVLIENAINCHHNIIDTNNFCRIRYNQLLSEGLNRETARTVLNLNQYTEWYWKIDLHNLLHFLSLRMDRKAQWEIREYANAIASYVKQWCPLTWKAFEEYILYGVSFSQTEMKMIRSGIYSKPDNMSQGEYNEFKQKIGIE